MRGSQFRRCVVFLAALTIAVCFVLPGFAEEEISAEDLEVEEVVEEVTLEDTLVSRPLPIDFTGGAEPQEQFYLDENTYQDPTISVQITYKDITDYQGQKSRTAGAWIVDIRIGDASQLRTAAAESFDTNTTAQAVDIARRVNAVAAFNGDYVTRLNEGFILRQGQMFRDKLKGRRDVLLIDEDGDFHVFTAPKKGDLSDTVDGKKVINAFYFGPILVENGEIPKKMTNFTYLEPDKFYTRLAICQIGPLHYKMILTTNNQDSNRTSGLKIRDFAQLCRDEGAQTAFNLDGGFSTTLYFHQERINSQENVNFREVPDIIYFASAWDGGENE